MGNCQTVETGTVVLQHPSGTNKTERMYWSVTANEVMSSNPGHYVALVVTSPNLNSENGMPLKQLNLLRPDDTLLLGQVYRLITFEDVLKEFATKKCVKLGKLLKQRSAIDLEKKNKKVSSLNLNRRSESCGSVQAEQEMCRLGVNIDGTNKGVGRQHGSGQWRPALQSIAEVET